MRRFFDYDYDFDVLELGITSYLSTPAITPFRLSELIPLFPINPPLSAEIDGTSGDDVLEGTADADTIRGGLGNDVINGNDGNDRLFGEEGDDILNGGEGNDTLNYEVGGRDQLNGGAGNDTFRVSNRDSNVTDLVTITGGSGDDRLIHIDSARHDIEFFGGTGDDIAEIYFGNTESEFLLDLGEGNDTLQIGQRDLRGDGTYQVTLGSGQDIIIMDDLPEGLTVTDFETGDGGDIFHFNAFESIFGWDNIENLFDLGYFELVQDGQDTILRIDSDGAAGAAFGFSDLAIFENTLTSDFTAHNFAGLPPQGGPISGGVINGTSGTDDLRGSLGADTINGLDGRDTISGGAGHDILNGGDGNDTLYGEAGDDILNGGNGNDSLRYEAGGNDVLNGGAGDDRITISPFEITDQVFTVTVDGGDGNDDFTHINLAQINLNFTGGEGDDIADIRFGNIDSVFNLDLGAGNDIVQLGSLTTSSITALGHYTITLGAGSDELNILNIGITPDNISLPLPTDIVVTDFETGVSGDNILFNFSENLEAWDGTIDPFANDLARIVQRTSSTEIQFRVTDTSSNFNEWATVATLLGVEALSILSENIAGYSPQDFLIYEGDAADNVISGTSNDDELSTFAGDDIITGGAGDDVIDGGDDTDHAIYLGEQANYTVTDNMNGTYTVIDNVGTDGTDVLSNIEFLIFADVTIDIAAAAAGPGPIDGTAGNDNLMGTADDDVINGLAGNDILTGLAGDDVLNGGEGADLLRGGEGADELNGGEGFDSADYSGATSGVRFNVETGGTLGEAAGDSFSGIERYFLSDFNDIVTGSDANEFFFGGAGNDQINGGGGIDRIDGGAGNDIQRGQAGNDTLFGSAGADQLNGGTGFDIANYSNATSSVIVNLAGTGVGGDAAGDTYFGIEAVYGSDFNDALNGNASANELRGGDGNDTLNGNGGNDRLFGGEGADILDGGAGTDIAVYTTASEAVAVNLAGLGTAGEADGDFYDSVEWVWGSAFDDTISGDSANNRLEGRDGNDTLNGAAGNDRLLGGDGNDTINGGDGVDTIFGQDGDDILSGGGGNDFFFGDDGADSHDGGTGIDTVSYLASSTGVTVNLQTGGTGGDAAGDSYANIERIFGTSHDDSITGSVDDDVLLGNGGADFLDGGLGGNDTLIGGAGIDSFGFSATDGGSDIISGFFTANEVIFIYDTFGGENGPEDFAGLLSIASSAGANTIFNFSNGSTLTLVGVDIADLSANNFEFDDPLANNLLSNPDAFAADMVDVFDMDALF